MKVEQTDQGVREALSSLALKGEWLSEYTFLLGKDSEIMKLYGKSRGSLYGVRIKYVEGSDLELTKRQ